jgi:hypothetical protein
LQPWPYLLPHLTGLPASLSFSARATSDPWVALRGAALRLGPRNCDHGYSAVGLPWGGVVTVMTDRRYALRTSLGCQVPVKVPIRTLEESEERRKARRKQRKIDEKREATLAEMQAGGGRARTDPMAGSDLDGKKRDQYTVCNACLGYCGVDRG